ncbi:HTH-type transcriptional regulator DmlR [Zhongshania aliphaticivorans]|uniref:HTH-type transcriptional regulator DmlR n=1 Tax=Zhongshania aliphaticivorans TaxID=1470434 RepID=A0A5S9N4K0_9GAMM|nr:LysR substrate-binding domain-containing protein [Zhongshania aliphaticivorans]CAA0082273.1 HTH-type transcriptional regulator DmlR [Zhongshania aliphaticivorans]CAA0084450.1 HTH-type transcriptional regulator DmlR [Zhongshania aliphaticivorans]
MMIWSGVSEFVAVAETGSFTAAAKRLRLSVAQISRQVTALEARLNVRLLHRTTRKVMLTEAGAVYFRHCSHALEGLDEAERAVSDLQSTPQGKIKLTAPITFGEERIMPLVNDFMVLHPQLEVECHLSNQLVDILADGYDLAIRLGHLPDSSMIARKLSVRRRFVCAAPGYINRFGVPHTLSELEQHHCLVGGAGYWRFVEGGKARSIKVSGPLRCNSAYALVDAALKNLGLIQVPDYYVQEHIQQGRLLTALEPYCEPDEGIWAVYPFNRQLSPKIKSLVAYLSEHMSAI